MWTDIELIKLETSIKRIANDIDNITKITATPHMGCTRLSYSEEDKRVREYLLSEMKYLGLSIRVDGVGNIRAKYETKENSNKPSIMVGSHIDTVPNGGKFDGLTGVVSALEVIRVLNINKVKLKYPIELIVFAEEEGSNFGITMLGSKVLTGVYGLQDLKEIRKDENISAYQLMKDFGLDVNKIEEQVLLSKDVRAMIELHVEQGGILEQEGFSVGIVEAIVGMKVYKVTINGVSNHAGTTPMNLRKDPMLAAAEIILHLKDVAQHKARKNTVATVGKINSEPNASNVIANKVEIFVDVRDVESIGIDIVSEELNTKVVELKNKYDVEIQIELIGESKIVNLSSEVIDMIEKTASHMNLKYRKMNSGAVHDAAMLTELTNVGMIFVPSKGGTSHSPDEMTSMDDIKRGSDLLLGTVIKLSNK